MSFNKLSKSINEVFPNQSEQWVVLERVPDDLVKYILNIKNKEITPIIGAQRLNMICVICFNRSKKNNKLVKVNFQKNKLKYKIISIEKILTELPSFNFIQNDSEQKRILEFAQKDLSGIRYNPILCSEDHGQYYYIALAKIEDQIQTKQLILIHVLLNSKGHYEINHVQNLL